MVDTNNSIAHENSQINKGKLTLLEQFKEIIFYSNKAKELLTLAINWRMDDDDDVDFDRACHMLFFELSATDSNDILANCLRHLTNHTLNTSAPELYNSLSQQEISDRIETLGYQQIINQTYASQPEIVALSKILGVNLVVTNTTPDRRRIEQSTETIYEQENTKGTVHLYKDDKFYFVDEGKEPSTVGNYNCFYSAVAQHLHCFILLEALQIKDPHNFIPLNDVFNQPHRQKPLSEIIQEIKSFLTTEKTLTVEEVERADEAGDVEKPADSQAPLLNTDELGYLNLVLRYVEPYSPLLIAIAVGITVSLLTAASSGFALVPGLAMGAGAALAVSGFFAYQNKDNIEIDDNSYAPLKPT